MHILKRINNLMEGFTLLLFCLSLLNNIAATTARDTIDTTQPINDSQILVSAGEIFALGFFSPGNSKNRYLGIWFHKIPTTVVWVANRNNPFTDSSGVLKINEPGILVLLNHNNSVMWSSNSTRSTQYPVAKLLDTGNFVVQDSSNTKDILWQSFDYPVDTILTGQKFGRNLKTGLNHYLSSWNSSDDPSPGKYKFQLDNGGYPEFFLREGTVKKRYRVAPWNGVRFSGASQYTANPIYINTFVINNEETYYKYDLINKSVLHRQVLTTDGLIKRHFWRDEESGWIDYYKLPMDDCDYYETCGAFSSCNTNQFPMCNCLDGFVHNTTYKDCVRRTSLSCHEDGFRKFSGMKLPDTVRSWFDKTISLEDCRMLCMKNCSCTAYAALDISNSTTSGCLLWFDKLIDLKYTGFDQDIYIRMAGSELAIEGKQSHKSRQQVTVIISCVSGIFILSLAFIIYRWQKGRRVEGNLGRQSKTVTEQEEEDLELPLFDMSTITFATNNFSTDNKLGEGGFGSVYKVIK